MDKKESERRAFTRYSLKAYGIDHKSRVKLKSGPMDVKLIDISPAGARLIAADKETKPKLERLETVHFSATFRNAPEVMKEVEAEVRWVDGPEFGIQFKQTFKTIGVSELQNYLND